MIKTITTITMLILTLVLLPSIYAETNYKQEYIIDKVIESSFNNEIWQNDELNLTKYENMSINQSNILSAEEAIILIDKEGAIVKFLTLQNELDIQISEAKNTIDVLIENTNHTRLKDLNIIYISLVKLENELASKNLSELENEEIVDYYIETKYQALMLIKTFNEIKSGIMPSDVIAYEITNTIEQINETTDLETTINYHINNYNSEILTIYLRKMGIRTPSLIKEIKEGELNKTHLETTLTQELDDMDSFEVDIIYERLRLKEKLDSREVISLYEELNISVNNTKIEEIIIN